MIFNHEQVHAKHFHSLDVIIFEIIGIFCWFNPIVYAYKRAIKNIHEFIADEIASKSMSSKAKYAILLLSEKFQTHPSVLVSNFFTKTSLKLRIEMLNKNRSNKTAILKYGLIAPMFLGMMVFASASIVRKNSLDIDKKANDIKYYEDDLNKKMKNVFAEPRTLVFVNGEELNHIELTNILTKSYKYRGIGFHFYNNEESKKKFGERGKYGALEIFRGIESKYINKDFGQGYTEEVFTVVEKPAEYNGGIKALGKFLEKNLKYPSKAQKANVKGIVFLSFIVSKSGEISEVEVKKGIGYGCDEEAIRVVNAMPKWKPAKQSGREVNSIIQLPISFVIE